jgi:hypothetical protein
MTCYTGRDDGRRMQMNAKKDKPKPYVWVTDRSGKEYLCPADALKKPEDASAEELENCIDAGPWQPYLDD